MESMKLVLSQSYQNDPKRRDTEQELVASLLMQDRIEVILIDDTAQLENESTDALCIQGIRGDMLVAAWHNTVDCMEHLRRLGIVGEFDGDAATTPELPIALPSGQYDAMRRRIVCLDLTASGDAANSRQKILTVLRGWEQRDQTISSATPCVPVKENVSQLNKPVKVMPRRRRDPTSLDDLDLLLDEMDGSNL